MHDVAAIASVCSACGEPLKGKVACLPCLLRAGLGKEEEAAAPRDSEAVRAAVFGDFEIERRDDGSLYELGRGAVGITYRAIDKVLHRTVALKVIEPPAASSDSQAMRERFLREARAAAALRHPNVAGVFHFSALPELNRCYCAMELVEGETLEARVRHDGRLSAALVLEIAVQVARALMAAAERGLVHRDLKPGNIMLARAQDPAPLEVKVIDFGLAKAISTAEQMELTHGGFVGTPAFASPEQFAGGTVDARADIYALGVTMWFALTGRLPSAGTTIEEIRERQAHHKLPMDQLRANAVPQPLIDLLRSCLAIDPAERPASARELLGALETCRQQISRAKARRKLGAFAIAVTLAAAAVAAFLFIRVNDSASPRISANAPPIEKGLAVLPFENLSDDKADAFFTDGMQDDVLTTLGKIKDLKVIARGSVAEYRGARAAGKLREIAQTLGVSHVLEGSVRRSGDRVVVNAALIDARNERQLWSERYERSMTDALSLQGELALEISRALRATLSPAEASLAATKPTENADAYLLYLRGREVEIAAGFKMWEKAIQFYQQAIDLDPEFALARARLSICASQQAYERSQPELKSKARAEADEALRLRPDLGEARLALGVYYLMSNNDTERARVELASAAQLSPSSAEVALIEAFVYKRQGNMRARIAALLRAEALDPRNTRVVNFTILTRRWVRDWPEAIRALDRYDVLVPLERPERRRWGRANLEFQLNGDIEILKRVLAEAQAANPAATPEWITAAQYELAMLERDYPAAARLLVAVTENGFNEATVPTMPRAPKAYEEALLAVASGAPTRRQPLEAAGEELRARLAAGDPERPDHYRCAELAIVYAFLGNKEGALRELKRGESALQGPAGSIERNHLAAALALIHAQTGETDNAIEMIEHLLTVPADLMMGSVYNMTVADLRWRWVWDPLRSHPRFQKLLAGPEPKTVY